MTTQLRGAHTDWRELVVVLIMLFVVLTASFLLAYTMKVSSTSRQSSVAVPYWVFVHPATEDEWILRPASDLPWWEENPLVYKTPEDSRCQMFRLNRRRLVPVYEDETVTVARYEIHWLYRFFDYIEEECSHGTVIRFDKAEGRRWLHALGGWGVY